MKDNISCSGLVPGGQSAAGEGQREASWPQYPDKHIQRYKSDTLHSDTPCCQQHNNSNTFTLAASDTRSQFPPVMTNFPLPIWARIASAVSSELLANGLKLANEKNKQTKKTFSMSDSNVGQIGSQNESQRSNHSMSSIPRRYRSWINWKPLWRSKPQSPFDWLG